MRLAYIFFVVLLMGFSSATGVICTIVDDKVLVEIELQGEEKVIFPEDYSLIEEGENKVSFVSRDFLRKDGEYIFALPVIINSSYSLRVYLPRNHVLSDRLVYPKDYRVFSDGTNIVLEWDKLDSEEVIVFYEGAGDSSFFVWGIVFLVLIVGVGFNFWQRRKFSSELDRLKSEVALKEKKVKEKKKEMERGVVLKNLFGEERRIVEFLLERKSCWMKEIVNELGISKVMATRKVRSLVEKGLVEKESFGRENRVRLVGK